MDVDKKKYNAMENVLAKINQKYISLPENEKKINNKILERVTDKIISLMKEKDVLFRSMYERKFYGGSYYDGIKVGKPEEYDLDFVLNLPLIIEPALENSDKSGFVNIFIKEYSKLLKRDEAPKFEKLNTLMTANYLSTSKVLQWMEHAIKLALNHIEKQNGACAFDVTLDSNESVIIYATVSKAHPAFTLKLKNKDGSINLDIDLVPCFQFTQEKWPKSNYRPNPFPSKNKFLIVPKKPHGILEDDIKNERYWRLSFQEQERELIKGHEFKMMKPTIKLLKKLRDKHNHIIASYYIKTIFLWEVTEENKNLWRNSQSFVFMTMLKKYASMIQNKNISYYWNRNNNLIAHLKDVTLTEIGNKLKNIIDDIEAHLEDPFLVAKYLINQDQLETLRDEVNIGRKHNRILKIMSNPSLSLGSASITPVSEEERIKRLTTDVEFVGLISEHIAKYLEPKLLRMHINPSPAVVSQSDGSSNKEILTSLNELHSKTDAIVNCMTRLTNANENLYRTCDNLNHKVSILENNMAELYIKNNELRAQLKSVTKERDNVKFNYVSDNVLLNCDRLALPEIVLPKMENGQNHIYKY